MIGLRILSDVHTHATHAHIDRANYFDVGTEVSTYTLFIQKAKLPNYGDKLVKVYGPIYLGILYLKASKMLVL
jgi:hypothetical protein